MSSTMSLYIHFINTASANKGLLTCRKERAHLRLGVYIKSHFATVTMVTKAGGAVHFDLYNGIIW